MLSRAVVEIHRAPIHVPMVQPQLSEIKLAADFPGLLEVYGKLTQYKDVFRVPEWDPK
jgi:hypothetical protein